MASSDTWIVQSMPAAPINLTATADAINASSQIDLSWANAAGSDATGFAVYRSTDGVNFSLLTNSLPAGTTSYSDTGLSAGTTYYYQVVTLLNSDGSSTASNTASATT